MYYEMLIKLIREIQNRHQGKPSSDVVLFHENARLHTAALIKKKIQNIRWNIFMHPPYSSGLASSEHLLFIYLKQWISVQGLEVHEKFKAAIFKRWNSKCKLQCRVEGREFCAELPGNEKELYRYVK